MKRRTLAMLLALFTATVVGYAAGEEKTAAAQVAAPAAEAKDAAEAPKAAEDEESYSISADRMEMEMGDKATLEGNVLLESSRMLLSGDRVTIFFEADEDADGGEEDGESLVRGTGQVSRIEATGGVMIRTPDGERSATGERGYYDPRQDIFILEGSCTILADGHALKSNKVIFDHRKQTFSAERAALTFNLKKSDKGDGGDILGGVFSVTGEKKDKGKAAGPQDASGAKAAQEKPEGR